MIQYRDVVLAVRQGKKALDDPQTDVNHLRFLVNKMTYFLRNGVLLDEVEAL